jgi:hypothetical protein
MTGLIERTLRWLGEQVPGRLSMPGDDRYSAATAIWAKPIGHMPRAVVHCRTAGDVGSAVRAARDCDLPLSVRGGGHDWAGRAPCDGIVIDLSGMNAVACSQEAPRPAWRRAMGAMSNGSPEPSGIMIPTTSSAPPFRCRPAGQWPAYHDARAFAGSGNMLLEPHTGDPRSCPARKQQTMSTRWIKGETSWGRVEELSQAFIRQGR